MEIAASTTPKDTHDIVALLKEQLSLLESKYSSMRPDVIRLKENIAGLEAAEEKAVDKESLFSGFRLTPPIILCPCDSEPLFHVQGASHLFL